MAQRALVGSEAAARKAEAASRHYAETLPHGCANGIAPNQAITLAQTAAELAGPSASTMRRAMAAAATENAQDRMPHYQ